MVALTVQRMSCAAAGQYSTSSFSHSGLSSSTWMANHSQDQFAPHLCDSEDTVVHMKIASSCLQDDALSKPFYSSEDTSGMIMDNVLAFDIVQLQASLLRTAPIRREGHVAENESNISGQPQDTLGVVSSKVGCPEHESAASQKSPSTRPLGSVFGWMKSKLGLGRQSDSSDHNSADEAGMEKVLTEVSPEVAEEILAVASATWSRPSHDFRTGRSARTSHGSAELLRTSSEPGTVARRRRAREFARNLDFYKDMAEGDEPAQKRRSLSMTNLPDQAQGSRSSGEEERKLNAVRAQGVQQAFQKSRASVGQRDFDAGDMAVAAEYLTPELVERVSTYCAPPSSGRCDIATSEFFKSCSQFS